jgi:hypothetical protein
VNILIIGNGFDLEHGLPTRYEDFLKFISSIKRKIDDLSGFISYAFFQNSPNINKNLKKYMAETYCPNGEHPELEMMKNLISKNVWVEYFIEKEEYDGKGWIDFESEISEVVRCLDYMRKIRYKKELNNYDLKAYEIEKKIIQIIITLKNTEPIHMIEGNRFKIDLQNISDDDYYEYVIKQLLEDLNNLTKCLEIYLTYCIGQDDIKYLSPDIEKLDIDKVLSFNYTDTYRKVYANDNNKIEYDFIHGKVAEKEDFNLSVEQNNMVLGIDEYLDSERRKNEIEFIGFKKYFQRIYKETSCKYKKWILEMNESQSENEKNNIYIFGHSLDITDKDILKELIESENTVTTIFYYDKKVYYKQISNLVKVLEYDGLISRVQNVDKRIIFKQQYRYDNEDN